LLVGLFSFLYERRNEIMNIGMAIFEYGERYVKNHLDEFYEEKAC
jgi:hypothetical protein